MYNFIFIISNAALGSLLQSRGGQLAVDQTDGSGSSGSTDRQGWRNKNPKQPISPRQLEIVLFEEERTDAGLRTLSIKWIAVSK
jgi:hypothetical protein